MLRDAPGDRPPYEVRETAQFDADWRREIQQGNLYPMVAPSDLLFSKMLLAQEPYSGRWQPGAAYDNRTIVLARVFEIGYYVVEDDRAVYLDSIVFVGADYSVWTNAARYPEIGFPSTSEEASESVSRD